MYVFSNISLLLTLSDHGLIKDGMSPIYVTEMAMESKCYDYFIQNKLRKLVEDGKVRIFSLQEDFFKFAVKESIIHNRIDLMSFACIYFAKKENFFLVTTNKSIMKCAEQNGVLHPPIKEILTNILKEERYVELILKE